MTPVHDNKFQRAWLQLDALPGGMMNGPQGLFGPIPASTSAWVTTSEKERDSCKAQGKPMLEVWVAPAEADRAQQVVELQAQVAELQARLGMAQADTEILDWLEKRKYRETRDGGYSAFFSVHLVAMQMGPWARDNSGEFDHKTLRAAAIEQIQREQKT